MLANNVNTAVFCNNLNYCEALNYCDAINVTLFFIYIVRLDMPLKKLISTNI